MKPKNISEEINHLLDRREFVASRQVVQDELKRLNEVNRPDKLFLLATLYGHLIDIGHESYNEADIEEGINFFTLNKDLLLSQVTKASYYYNLAYAEDGLARIFYYKNRGIHSLETQKVRFQTCIQHYWTAVNAISDEQELYFKISINLSNALTMVGRLVEAFQFQDEVLKKAPGYPQALVSRADHLYAISQQTNCSVSAAMYYKIYSDYDAALRSGYLPPDQFQRVSILRTQTQKIMEDNGFSLKGIEKEVIETTLEFNRQSPFRKYCIENHLTLNEHGIFCGCSVNGTDDLQIGVRHGAFRIEVLPKLELLLNRLKSEFALARWSYYHSLNNEISMEFGTAYSDLLEHEIISPSMELQRNSFRVCYGVLDKLALGICKLYNVPAKRIHFETFWEDAKLKQYLNKTGNFHLNALYSIACDLNTSSGELKHFKNWRNKLEHNLLIVKDTFTDGPDILKVFEDKDFVAVVDANLFREKALHLLQLTRAAIFSFVYCVRLQIIEHPTGAENDHGFPIRFK